MCDCSLHVNPKHPYVCVCRFYLSIKGIWVCVLLLLFFYECAEIFTSILHLFPCSRGTAQHFKEYICLSILGRTFSESRFVLRCQCYFIFALGCHAISTLTFYSTQKSFGYEASNPYLISLTFAAWKWERATSVDRPECLCAFQGCSRARQTERTGARDEKATNDEAPLVFQYWARTSPVVARTYCQPQ